MIVAYQTIYSEMIINDTKENIGTVGCHLSPTLYDLILKNSIRFKDSVLSKQNLWISGREEVVGRSW